MFAAGKVKCLLLAQTWDQSDEQQLQWRHTGPPAYDIGDKDSIAFIYPHLCVNGALLSIDATLAPVTST